MLPQRLPVVNHGAPKKRESSTNAGQFTGTCIKLAIMPRNRESSGHGPRKLSKAALAARNILVLHGPNLNLLGRREPDIYGRESLADIDARLTQQAQRAGARLECFQSNSEAELIQRIHLAQSQGVNFIIINPAAFTHTSIALRDALAGVGIPFVEIHLSNVHAREPFRRRSYFSDLAVGVVAGLGAEGYRFALEFALSHTEKIDHGLT